MRWTTQRPWDPQEPPFRWWHGGAWLLYLWLLKLDLEWLWDARQHNAMVLLPALVLGWVVLGLAGAFIGNWLTGAGRAWPLRLGLIGTAIPTCALGVWMMWQYAVSLLVGLVTWFRFPFELISLTLVGARALAAIWSLIAFAFLAWMSLRVIWVLLSGEPRPLVAHLMGDVAFGARFAGRDVTPTAPPAPAAGPDGDLGIAIRRLPRLEVRLSQSPHTRPLAAPAPAVVPEVWGKQRYLARPPAMQPGPLSRGFLHGMAYRRGIPDDAAARCRDLGWSAFEWAFRAQPSLQELAIAVQALPNLARHVDDEDAAEARAWLDRLADHPGSYERDLPYQEIINEITHETIRIADLARRARADWDRERATLQAPR